MTIKDEIDELSGGVAGAVARNMQLAEDTAKREAPRLEAQRKAREARVEAAYVGAVAWNPANVNATPGATAFERAVAALNAPAKSSAAPAAKPAAAKPVERVTSAPVARPSGGPINALMGGNPADAFITRAAHKGVLVQRAPRFTYKCDIKGCTANAAWILDGIHACNQHHEHVLKGRELP